MNKLFLRHQSLLLSDAVDSKTGKFKGVAYTGAVIQEHGIFQNLVIDLKSLTVQKKKTPILRDHMTSQVAGSGSITVNENGVYVEGALSKRTVHGNEIVTLSEDGVDWELSLGIYGGKIREFENEEINGVLIAHGFVLENGVIREASFVILGADAETSAEVFSAVQKIKKETEVMKLNQHDAWAKFACGCGGTKDSTPEELEKKFAENAEEIAEKQAELDKKQAEIDALKAEIEALKREDEEEEREEQLSAAAKEKGLKLSAESLKKASKSKEATEILLGTIKDMEKVPSKIDPKFTKDLDLSKENEGSDALVEVEDDAVKIRLAANKLIKDGKAKSVKEAMSLIVVKEKE